MGLVEKMFNVGHPHDPVMETQSLIIALSFVGIVLILFGICVGVKHLINYFRGGKKK